jgi:hypothetical protein
MASAPPGKLVGFKAIDEPWTLIRLDDGNYLRIKLVPTKVLKLEMPNPDGTPAYLLQSGNVMTLLTASELQKMCPERTEVP